MKRIFFVDDDEDDRDVFQMALKGLNIETDYVEAIDGQDALDKIHRADFAVPDLIFVDLNMPRLNGLEFILKMKQMDQYKDVPTYVYTTSTSPRERVNCLSSGASGYIIKHVNHADLTKDLNDLLLKLGAAA